MSLQLYNSSVFFGSPIYTFPIADPPSGLTLVSTTPSSVTVSVTAPAGEVYGYYAYTNTGADANSKTTTITISGLAASTTYTVYVKTLRSYGVDNSGNYVHSAPTSGLSATTSALVTTTSFSPTTISGLQLWLDASDPNNTGVAPSNGSTISTWYDRSGNGRNATANTPITYNTSGLSSGKAALTFTNTQYLSGNVSIQTNTATVFVVCSMNTNSNASARALSFATTTGGNDYDTAGTFIFMRSGTGIGPYRNGTYTTNSATSYSTPYLWETWFDGTNQYATVQIGNTSTIGSNASSGNFAITYYRIGSMTNGQTSGLFYGFISEILIFNTSLSTTDRQKVEGYLSWKWGLQTNLPSSPAHPYYSSVSLSTAFALDASASLVNYYRFESADINSTSLLNYKTSSYDATLVNGTARISTTGYYKVGSSAVQFISANSRYITLPSYTDTTNKTFSFWFSTSSTNAFLLNFRTSGNTNPICLYSFTSGYLHFLMGGTDQTLSISVNDSIWRHLVWVMSGTTWYIYINALLVATYTGMPTTNAITRTENALGCTYSPSTYGTGNFLDGYMDDFRIYSTVLTATDVANLYSYNGDVTTFYLNTSFNLLYYYPFDSGDVTSTSVKNYVTGSNDLSLINGGTLSSTTFKVNKSSLYLTGTQYALNNISLTVNSNTNNNGMSFSFWQKISNTAQVLFELGDAANNLVHLRAVNGDLELLVQYGSPLTYYGGYFSGVTNYINDGNWHHILWVIPSGATSTWAFYVDGVVFSLSIVLSGYSGYRYPNSTTYTKLTIGASITGSSPFNGYIDDFRFYNSALNSVDASNLYNYLYYGGSVLYGTGTLSAPTIGSATSITAFTATIGFTAPSDVATGTTYAASAGGKVYGAAVYPATSIYVHGLSSNTSYSFTVTATTSTGTSSASGAVTVLTLPSAPKIGNVSITGTSGTVAFTAPSGSGTITGYTATSIPDGITGTGTSPITVSGLTAGSEYYFTVKASNSTGTSDASSYSDLVHGSTANVTTPSSLSVSYTAPKGSMAVRYYAVTNTGVSSYSTTTPITISGLAANTSYTVTIYGYNIFGRVVSKSSVSATTSASSIIFSSDGSSLTSWGSVNGGGSISASIGNPASSISLSGSGFPVIYYNIGQSLLNTTIQFDMNAGTLANANFACNSSGNGNIWRLEARGGSNICGFITSTLWKPVGPTSPSIPSLSANTWYTIRIVISSSGVATAYVNGTLQSGTYTITNSGNYIGFNGDGGGGTSYVDNISVIGGTVSALSAPTIGSASSITSSTATISFTAPSGAASGTTYAASAGGTIYGAAAYPETSIYVDGLSSNTSYSFTVTATTSAGTSSASGAVTVLTLAAAPKIGTATVSGTTASVAFTTVSGSGTITSYTATSIPGGITGTGSTTPISVSGLTATTSYYFTVTATNSTGTSSSSNYSNEITVSAIPSSGLVFQLTFATSSVPTNDTYGSTITSYGAPTMINNATRGYVLSCTNTANLIAQIATTSSFSRCLWLYPLSIASNSSNILSTNNFPVWYQNGVNLSMQTTAYTDPVSRGTNLWLHYVVTYNSSTSTVTLYVNGTSAFTSGGLTYAGEANYLYINGGNQNGNYSRMNAYYDNIRLYNRALSESEVSAMYTYENSNPTA